MLNSKLFEFAEIHCANDYIMAREEQTWEEAKKYIESNNLRLENLIFKPKTNQIRFMFMPCKANSSPMYPNGMTEVFNVSNPPAQFLRMLWNIDEAKLRSALSQYMVQSDLRHKYDELEEDDKTWLTSVILGAKEEE